MNLQVPRFSERSNPESGERAKGDLLKYSVKSLYCQLSSMLRNQLIV